MKGKRHAESDTEAVGYGHPVVRIARCRGANRLPAGAQLCCSAEFPVLNDAAAIPRAAYPDD